MTTNVCFHWLIGRSSTLRKKFGVTSHARESFSKKLLYPLMKRNTERRTISTDITPDDDAEVISQTVEVLALQ